MHNSSLSDSALYWLALSLHDKRSPAFWLTWLAHHKINVEHAFTLSNQTLLDMGLHANDCQAFDVNRMQVKRAIAWTRLSASHRILDIGHSDYPESLKQLSSPPLALYCLGNHTLISRFQIAIVGSRKATLPGLTLAREFAQQLGQIGITVTSGLALGIDGAAHQGAIDTPGNSIAVMGAGLEHIHPKSHLKLADRLLASGGCMVSEFAPWLSPKPYYFPRRNRIIAGMCEGVLVVESKIKSGSMITANLAAEAGKEVFAIPGNIKHPLTQGPHYLIQQGAKLTTCIKDITAELAFEASESMAHIMPKQHSLPVDTATQLLDSVNCEFTSVDELATRSGLDVSQVMVAMLQYELSGQITAVPGGYIRNS